jgi:hypothetical protein
LIRASPDSFPVAWIEKRCENSSLAATIVREPVGDMDRLTRGIRPKPERQFRSALEREVEAGRWPQLGVGTPPRDA